MWCHDVKNHPAHFFYTLTLTYNVLDFFLPLFCIICFILHNSKSNFLEFTSNHAFHDSIPNYKPCKFPRITFCIIHDLSYYNFHLPFLFNCALYLLFTFSTTNTYDPYTYVPDRHVQASIYIFTFASHKNYPHRN